MKIRTRLSIQFTIITATILGIFAAIVYYSAKENREKEFYALLKKEAITKVHLFLDANIEQTTLQEIYRSNRQILSEVEVAIYDASYHLVYHDAVAIDFVKENRQMMREIAEHGEINFYLENWQVIGLRYTFDGRNYLITAAAVDDYGYAKLDNLFHTIVLLFFASIAVIYASGNYFSREVLEPVKAMTKKAGEISAKNLDLRLPDNNNQDELSQLANTFNALLDRLENSFDAQKHFVYHISHELRTPLAAMITELELSENKERRVEEYKVVIRHALSDAKKLVRLFNSLLDFAKASYDTATIAFKPTRIDEVLLDARQEVQRIHPDYKVDIQFAAEFFYEEQDLELTTNGNSYLLKVAFVNLLENGCKFSDDKKSTVYISQDSTVMQLRFTDKGIGISTHDIQYIFTPFYRGENKAYAAGNGIGLALTQRIIALHQGTIAVEPTAEKGTTILVKLPARTV